MKHVGVPEIRSPAIPVALSSKKSPDEVGSLLSFWDGIFKVQSLWGLQFEGFLPHSAEFLICPDARLKPQGLGSSYLQRGVWISFVLRGFRMSIHVMFHVFAAFLVASF